MQENHNKIYSPAIDNNYNPHTFVHTDVNHPVIAQKYLYANLDIPLSTM